MKKLLLAAAAAALVTSAPANAAVVFSFSPGGDAPTFGYTVIDTFDNADGVTGSGFQIKTPPTDLEGAVIPNSSPTGTPYLSVLAGGEADIAFDSPVSSFQFDWGSLDDYNTLTIYWTGGQRTVTPGTDFANPANGDQHSPLTNGLFTVWGDADEAFTGLTLASSSHSFEIDNLAVASAVPEPDAWAMMILGIGAVGGVARWRRRQAKPVPA
jgi:hypothetical protein